MPYPKYKENKNNSDNEGYNYWSTYYVPGNFHTFHSSEFPQISRWERLVLFFWVEESGLANLSSADNVTVSGEDGFQTQI